MHHELAWLVSSDDSTEESSVFFAAYLGGNPGMQWCNLGLKRAQAERSHFEGRGFGT